MDCHYPGGSIYRVKSNVVDCRHHEWINVYSKFDRIDSFSARNFQTDK